LWASNFPQFCRAGLPPRTFPVGWDDTIAANASLLGGRESTVVTLGELMMILELHRQGLKVSAIARQLGIDRKTVRRYISRGLEPPTYGPRPPRQRSTDRFLPYVRERLAAFPGLTAVRLWRELRERGYAGGYTAVKRAVRGVRPDPVASFEVRFETAPGEQAQVDLARFEVEFTDEPGVKRIGLAVLLGAWLLSLDLGPLRRAPGHAIGPALPHRSAGSDRRRTARNSLRPHEDRGHR
jgi:hypothetical protein